MATGCVDASSATILLTEAPAPKLRDRQTRERAVDAVSGEALMTVGVVYIDEGESSLIQVTVPESGVTDGLTVGAPVSLLADGLVLLDHGRLQPEPSHRPGGHWPSRRPLAVRSGPSRHAGA